MCVEQAMKVEGLFKGKATTLLWRHGSSTSTPLCWRNKRSGVSVTLNLKGGKTDRNDILGTAALKNVQAIWPECMYKLSKTPKLD